MTIDYRMVCKRCEEEWLYHRSYGITDPERFIAEDAARRTCPRCGAQGDDVDVLEVHYPGSVTTYTSGTTSTSASGDD